VSEPSRGSDATFDQIAEVGASAEQIAQATKKALALPIWKGAIDPENLSGGLSTVNLVVEDDTGKYVVRVGGDVPLYGVVHANELISMRAMYAAGVAPEVVYAEGDVIVMRFIEGKAWKPDDARRPENLERLGKTIRRYHDEAYKHVTGPGFMFWPFHHNRWLMDQVETHKDQLDPRWAGEIPAMRALMIEAEVEIGAVNLVFAHNDLLPQNILDDGEKLWVVDWEYAGFDSHLFDLAGIAMNAEMNREEVSIMTAAYDGAPLDDAGYKRLMAMVLAASVRETVWSYLAEVTPRPIAFDYSIYSVMNTERHHRLLATYREF
jgi:thiamine kinase-like enzyme